MTQANLARVASPSAKNAPPTAVARLGALLAQGAIRCHDRQKNLDDRTEERVHTDRIDTQETPL
jgi:hypothetical protein